MNFRPLGERVLVKRTEVENKTFIYSNGVQIPLSTMDRNVFANLYEIAIMGSLEEHEEIILDIK